jgi:hypothetical protein
MTDKSGKAAKPKPDLETRFAMLIALARANGWSIPKELE